MGRPLDTCCAEVEATLRLADIDSGVAPDGVGTLRILALSRLGPALHRYQLANSLDLLRPRHKQIQTCLDPACRKLA